MHHLPDPIPKLDGGSYKTFEELYGTETTEEFRPSAQKLTKESQGMGFSPSAQYAKNVGMVVQCGECDKWRVLYSKSKLNHEESTKLSRFLDSIQYTCGDSFESLTSEIQQNEFSELFLKVKVNDKLNCQSNMEISYYSCGLFEDEMCFICGEQCEQEDLLNLPTDNEFYYYCGKCGEKANKKKRGKTFFGPNSRKKQRNV
jgi:hypothetical protein